MATNPKSGTPPFVGRKESVKPDASVKVRPLSDTQHEGGTAPRKGAAEPNFNHDKGDYHN